MRQIKRSTGVGCVLALLGLCGIIFFGNIVYAAKSIRFLTDETDPASVKVYKEIIAEYESKHPDIKIVMEFVPPGEDLILKQSAALVIGKPPEISGILATQLVRWVKDGHMEPVDDVISEIGKDDFIEGTIFRVDGHYYGLPYSSAGAAYWVRTDLFEKKGLTLPKTWQSTLQALEKLTEDTDGDGTIDRYGIAVPCGKTRATQLFLCTLMWQQGQTWFDKDFNPIFNTPKTAAALKLFGEIAKYAPPGIGEYSYGELVTGFVSERVATTWYWGRVLGRVARDAPHILEHIKAIPIPTDNLRATQHSLDILGIFKDSKYPQEAKEFAKFLITGERAVKFMHTVPAHAGPCLKSVWNLPTLWENPLLKSHRDSAEVFFGTASYGLDPVTEAGAYPKGDKMVRMEGVINPYFGKVEAEGIPAMMAQKHILQGTPAEEVVNWGYAWIKRLVEEAKRQ